MTRSRSRKNSSGKNARNRSCQTSSGYWNTIPVYTIGRTPDQSSLRGATHLPHPLVAINRGGQATWHGPGQLVGYFPYRPATPWPRSAPLSALDGRVSHRVTGPLRHCRDHRAKVLPACVWVANRKIASIGVGVRHWISMHGFALNVSGDLSAFNAITPCGIADVTMTSMENENGSPLPLAALALKAGALAVERIASLSQNQTPSTPTRVAF